MLLRLLLLATALCTAAAGAAAQKVYRCGPDGREYSHAPCKDGREVDVADTRSDAQQREGQQVAAGQRRLASQMEAQRRQRDAATPLQGAAGIKPLPLPAVAQAASSARKSKSDSKSKSKRKPSLDDSVAVPAYLPPPAKKAKG